MASFVRPDKISSAPMRLSKWEKADIRTERRTRMSKHELVREDIADKLRCPLCFCLPCVIMVFTVLILIGIYVVQPFIQGQGLVSTQCHVNRTEMLEEGSCSHRTDKFAPCLKIFVTYRVNQKEFEAVLMENEQALAHCEKCSFTFGNSDLFGRYTTCAWDSDLSAQDCAPTYLNLYGMPNNTFSCYFDPDNMEDVVRILKVSGGEAVAMMLIPLLFLLLWLLSFLFMVYDRHLRSNIDEQIIHENVRANKYPKKVATGDGPSLPLGKQNGGFDLETSTAASAASSANSGIATPRTRRRRKKKMPCSRQHYQFNYLDEGILLEDKPLSFAADNPSSYSFVTVDTSPVCTCHHNGYLEAGFDLLPYSRDSLAPVSINTSRSSRYSSQHGIVYLPESFV